MLLKNNFQSKVCLYFPFWAVVLWLLFTVLISEFGPWDYKMPNRKLFLLYMGLYIVSFSAGYIMFFHNKEVAEIESSFIQDTRKTMLKFFWVPFLIYFATFFEFYGIASGNSDANIIIFFKNFFTGIINPQMAYNTKIYLTSIKSSGIDFKNLILMGVTAPLMWIIIPATIFLWNDLSKLNKYMFGIYLFFEIAKWISLATNKGLFDLLFVFFATLIADYFLNYDKKIEKQISEKFSLIIIVFCLFFLSFSYFGYNITSRVKDVVVLSETNDAFRGLSLRESSESKSKPSISQRESSESKSKLFIKNLYYGLSSYLTQGYYSMGQAIVKDFTSTYGIGNSHFLLRTWEIFSGINLIDRTYPGKLMPEIDPYIRWHTAFVWWASDVSFPGVAIIMFVIGRAFAWVWYDAVYDKNIFSYSLLSLFAMMFFYISANNQVFAFINTFCAFWGIIGVRILHSKIYNIKYISL